MLESFQKKNKKTIETPLKYLLKQYKQNETLMKYTDNITHYLTICDNIRQYLSISEKNLEI